MDSRETHVQTGQPIQGRCGAPRIRDGCHWGDAGLHTSSTAVAKRRVTAQQEGYRTIRHAHGATSDASRTAVADRDFFSLHDNRDAPLPLGVDEHLIQPHRVPTDVVVRRAIAKGRPGLVRVGSARLAVDDYRIAHRLPPYVSRFRYHQPD